MNGEPPPTLSSFPLLDPWLQPPAGYKPLRPLASNWYYNNNLFLTIETKTLTRWGWRFLRKTCKLIPFQRDFKNFHAPRFCRPPLAARWTRVIRLKLRSQSDKLLPPPATVTWLLVFVGGSPLSFCNPAWWWFMAGWASWLNHWTERQVALPRPSPLYGRRMATAICLSVVWTARLSLALPLLCFFFFSLPTLFSFPFPARTEGLERASERAREPQWI